MMVGIQPNEHKMAEITGGPFAGVQGRDGRHYFVWRNPNDREVVELTAG